VRQHPAPDHLHYQAMTKFNPLPPPAELWEMFELKPLTGELIWRVQLSNRAPAGSTTGKNTATHGYKRVSILKTRYRLNRVVWAWVHGTDPGNLDIDHVDNDRANNRPWNLRTATRSQNISNKKGVKGCSFYKSKKNHAKPWSAEITINYKKMRLGYYATEAEARAAYEKASRDLHGEFSSVK